MYGPTTKERRLVIRLALSMANQGRTFRDDDYIALLVRLLIAFCYSLFEIFSLFI